MLMRPRAVADCAGNVFVSPFCLARVGPLNRLLKSVVLDSPDMRRPAAK